MQRRDYLTPDAAAALLGWVGEKRGERLLRVMFAKEARTGREIMVRTGGKRNGVRYKLTEPMLKRHCKELFIPTPDDLVADVKRHLRGLDGRVEAIVDERVAPQIEELRARGAKTDEAVREIARSSRQLGARLNRLESRVR